jgi:pimeloyl-ACP methyl ester carboxylesterase
MPIVNTNGINIYYEIHGEGQSLVLIGGLANDISDYERSGILSLLGLDFRVVAFDNRGVGRSDKPDMPYSIEMMSEDVAGLLAALDLERVNVLGVSMGGRIALQFALAHPQVVSKLLLVSTAPRVTPSWRRRALSALYWLPFFRGKYRQPYYAFKRQSAASSSYDCTSRLHELRMPTLILHGQRDAIAPYALAEEMHAKISGSEIIALGGGHTFLFLRPHQFVDAVRGFLK